MERLPTLPKSQSSFRRHTQISPSSVRMLRQVLDTRDTSRFINLSNTLKNIKNVPNDGSELSFQLSTLRKSVDKYSIANFHKENRLRDLKFKLREMKESQVVRDEDLKMQDYYRKLKKRIFQALEKIEEEIFDQSMLQNMQERMRDTKKFLEKREKRLKRRMEVEGHEFEVKSKLRKETVDSVNQFKAIYKEAVDQVQYEKDLLINEISRLETQSQMKKILIEKTEEHNRHRLEIVELTMIEERSAHFEEIRNSKLLHFFYDGFLRVKLSKEKLIFNRFNEAFSQVKIKTGLQNIEEVIERFLTQEHNYRELTQNLHVKEKKCYEYKDKINEMQKKVDFLSNHKNSSIHEKESLKDSIEDLFRLKGKFDEIGKIHLVINIWINSMFKRMGFKDQDVETLPLVEKFKLFSQSVSNLFKNFLNMKNIQENEIKRKKVRIQDIMQAYLALNVFRSRNQEKGQQSEKALKTFQKKNNAS